MASIARTNQHKRQSVPVEEDLLTLSADLVNVERSIRTGAVGWERKFDQLMTALRSARLERDSITWRRFCGALTEHSICGLFRSDPFVGRCAARPRGYSGDAALLDHIYDQRHDERVDGVADRLFRYSTDRPGPAAVRERRDRLTAAIDQAATGARSRILAVACGHLRELALSERFKDGQTADVIAFDQDPESLAEVARVHPGPRVRTVEGSVRGLLAAKHGADFAGADGRHDFDLVYAAGLYDYLSDAVATRLTQRLLALTAPGGRLLVANFVPGIPDVGFMESYMDWWLIYRAPQQMLDLVNALPADEVADAAVCLGSNENIVYLTVTRQ